MSGPWLSQLVSTTAALGIASSSVTTSITNVFSSPRDPTGSAQWVLSAGTKLANTTAAFRFSGAGGQMVRYINNAGTGHYDTVVGHTYLHVVDLKALSAADVSGNTVDPVLALNFRKGDASGWETTLDYPPDLANGYGSSHGNQLHLQQKFNRFYSRFVCTVAGVSSIVDLIDIGDVTTPFSFEIGFCGLYDITGLSGVCYDSVNQIYIDLGKTVESRGDSLSLHLEAAKNKCGWPLVNWNGASGGTSTLMLSTFLSDIATTPSRANNFTLIWCGHNDSGSVSLATTKANFINVTSRLTGGFRVLTCVYQSTWVNPRTSAADFIDQLNDWILSYYGSLAIDIRPSLLANGNGSLQDDLDIANKLTPTSLRTDQIHIGIRGGTIIADPVYDSIVGN